MVDRNPFGWPEIFWVALIKFNLFHINHIGIWIYKIFLFNFSINIILILNTIPYYIFFYSQYRFSRQKYKVQYVLETWPVYLNAIFAFLLGKIITWGQLYQQLIRPVARTYFFFFDCKNWNATAALLAVSQVVCMYLFLFFRL